MSVGEFCTREVVVAERGADIVEVAQLMRTYHVGDVIIIEHHGNLPVPVGIVTDRDIVVELLAQQVDPDAATAGDVMSRDLLTVTEKEGLWETLQQMRSRGIHRVPVVNGEGGLVGILALDDVIELLAEQLALLARTAGRSRKREQQKLDE